MLCHSLPQIISFCKQQIRSNQFSKYHTVHQWNEWQADPAIQIAEWEELIWGTVPIAIAIFLYQTSFLPTHPIAKEYYSRNARTFVVPSPSLFPSDFQALRSKQHDFPSPPSPPITSIESIRGMGGIIIIAWPLYYTSFVSLAYPAKFESHFRKKANGSQLVSDRQVLNTRSKLHFLKLARELLSGTQEY